MVVIEARILNRFEKKRVEDLRKNNTPAAAADSILLFQDEKGPIAAKTYGGSSWCSTQVKVERAQKIKGILNVFVVFMIILMTRCLPTVTKVGTVSSSLIS